MGFVRITLLPLVLVASLALASCGSDDDDGETGAGDSQTEVGAEPAGSKGTIAFSVPIASAEFFQGVVHGLEGAAEELGYSVRVLDADLSPDKQVSDLETLQTRKPEAVVAWTINPKAAESAYESLSSAGVPVIGMGSQSQGFDATVWVATTPPSGCDAMRQQAQYFAERVPGAKVLVVGGPPVPTLQQQLECMIKEGEAAGLEIAQQQDNVENTAAAAQSIVQDMLTTHPDARVIWTFNDDSAAGAAAVLAASGNDAWSDETEEGIIIGGTGGNPAAIQAIEAGKMTMTMDSDTVQLGIRAAQMAAAAAEGEPLPDEVVIPTKIWDESTIDSYIPPVDREIELTPLPR